jgi:hypothetical protein
MCAAPKKTQFYSKKKLKTEKEINKFIMQLFSADAIVFLNVQQFEITGHGLGIWIYGCSLF